MLGEIVRYRLIELGVVRRMLVSEICKVCD